MMLKHTGRSVQGMLAAFRMYDVRVLLSLITLQLYLWVFVFRASHTLGSSARYSTQASLCFGDPKCCEWWSVPVMSSPWYNRTGWLGVKHQLTYLPVMSQCTVWLGTQPWQYTETWYTTFTVGWICKEVQIFVILGNGRHVALKW